ncbi:hypothetical protein ACFL1K_05290 [Candidatus Omnitrophota bacterium]
MIVFFIPLLYLVLKGRSLKFKYFWLLFFGLLLLFFGNLLDFLDEFPQINDLFIVGKDHPLQDVFEDLVGFTSGFALFIIGVYFELRRSFIHTD